MLKSEQLVPVWRPRGVEVANSSAWRAAKYFRVIFPLYIASTAGLLANLLVVGPSGLERGVVRETSGAFVAAWGIVWGLSLLRAMPLLSYRPKSSVEFALPVLILLSAVSSIWSTDPQRSVVYSFVLLLNYLFCVSSIQILGFERAMRMAALTLIGMSVVGLLLGLAGFGSALYVDPHDRANVLGLHPLRGLSNHKITCGIYAAIGATGALAFLSKWRVAAFLLCSLMVLMSGSSAALLVYALCLLVFFLMSRVRMPGAVLWPVLGYLVVVTVLCAVAFGPALLELLGRDPTLTGRTVLWDLGLRAYAQRPVTGWGYLGYLGSYQFGDALNDYRKMANYAVPHFHNSYLQLLVELGAVGLGVYLFVLFGTLNRLFKNLRTGDAASLFSATVLLVYCVYGFVTNTFLRYNDLSTVMLMLVAIGVAQHRSAAREE